MYVGVDVEMNGTNKSSWLFHDMEAFCMSRAICDYPHERLVMQSFDLFVSYVEQTVVLQVICRTM